MGNQRETVAFAMWKAEADRAAPNVGKHRTPEAFANASDQDRTRWLMLADAALVVVQPDLEAALRVTLLDLIREQSEGEWDDETINTDVEMFLVSILTVINKADTTTIRDAALAEAAAAAWAVEGGDRWTRSAAQAAILALMGKPAPHVNETPKSEHEGADMLTLTAERDRLRVSNMQMLGDIAVAMGRIKQLTAKLADAMEGLEKCQAELDEYSRQEYPLDHSVHERYRQRDYNANPARITLAALKGETP